MQSSSVQPMKQFYRRARKSSCEEPAALRDEADGLNDIRPSLDLIDDTSVSMNTLRALEMMLMPGVANVVNRRLADIRSASDYHRRVAKSSKRSTIITIRHTRGRS
jgi:hypothetical protein